MYSLVIAGALLAAVSSLVTAGSAGGSTVVTSFPSGFELRQPPRDWICCTSLKDVTTSDKSKKVLEDFANGENDQRKTIALSPAFIAALFVAGSGEYCKYIEKGSTETLLTSPRVEMMKGTILSYYAKKAEDKTVEGVLATYEDLKKTITENGGEPKAQAWFKMMIVERTPEGDFYVGAPIRPL